MSILNIVTSVTGLVGVKPRIIYIQTNNTLAEVTATGYLNEAQQNGASFTESDMALVVVKSSPSAVSEQVAWLEVSKNGNDWSLVSSSSTVPLTSAHILVGNASGVATDVAMSGDATIANTGAVTIANDAITTAKILNSNVTLAKLASGITPAAVVKYAGQYTTTGGAAAEAITITGAVALTDRAFVQMVNDGTANVTIVSAVVTNNTLTVTFSADPGNDCIINYQLLRAAS